MNQFTSFSFNGEEIEGESPNPKKTWVRKTPLKARRILPEKPPRKHRNNRPETTENMSMNLSPKGRYGIEGMQTPPNIESGPPCLDSSTKIEDFNVNEDIDIGLESNEDCKTHEGYYDTCVADDNQFEETCPDEKNNKKIKTLSREGSNEPETWMKIELPWEIGRNLALILGEKLERMDELPPDMKMHLLTAKNIIEDELARNDGECDGLARNDDEFDVLADTGEAGDELKRPIEGSRFGKDSSAKLLHEMLDTSLKLTDIVEDYDESLDPIFDKGASSSKLLQELLDTSLKLSTTIQDYFESTRRCGKVAPSKLIQKIMDTGQDLSEIILEYKKCLNSRFGKNHSANLHREMVDTSIKLSDIVLDYQDISYQSYSRWKEEDHGNAGSFPTFVANFLLIAALFAVLVFPALFVKYAPTEMWPKSILMLFNMSQSTPT